MAPAVGIASAVLDAWLNALCNATNTSNLAVAFYAKLHIGIPGAAGTANAAGETTRKSVSFGAPAAATNGRKCDTDASTDWTNVSTAETISHLSFWDASTAGNFLGSAALTASKTLAVGDNFSIPSGSGTITITPIAAT
jgi:hypothetical protein